MRLTFRARLLSIVAVTSSALLFLVVWGSITAGRVSDQLMEIEDRYLPRLELGPQIEADFEVIRAGLQNAALAQDREALEATRPLVERLSARLVARPDALAPGTSEPVRAALDAWYSEASDVTRRIILGETGEALTESIVRMQARQKTVTDLLETATSFDESVLEEAFLEARRAQDAAATIRLLVSFATVFGVLALSLLLSRGVLRSLGHLTEGFARFGRGDFGTPIPVLGTDELGELSRQANRMAESLTRLEADRAHRDWIRSGLAGLADELRGEQTPAEVATRATAFLAKYAGAAAGAFYASRGGDETLSLLGHYALSTDGAGSLPQTFRRGEGLVGQAALEDRIRVVPDPPPDYLRVRSGLGEAPPRALVLLPLVHAGRTTGVLELATFEPWSARATELLVSVRETLAIALAVATARGEAHALLRETQEQAAQLTAQEEELRASNEELESQQEALRRTNEELTMQAEELDVQRRSLEARNADLEEARRGLQEKSAELAAISAYKSQFLTNVSHELRTPLNSMLLLSSLLADNDGGNLTAQQVEHLRTIHGAGTDLLALINQVLDLARIEARKIDLHPQDVAVGAFVDRARRVFTPLAEAKGLTFTVVVEPGLPETIHTDPQRVDQVLTNLVGNAVKFTERGSVRLTVGRPEPGPETAKRGLDPRRSVAFSIADTGPGIAPEDRDRIFQAFEQLDAGTGRRYGGTGLGLAIARELADLLGGELHVESHPGDGSTFVFVLPERAAERSSEESPPDPPPAEPDPPKRAGPRAATELLVVEDDRVFAQELRNVLEAQGIAYTETTSGAEALRLARELRPSGIVLDASLPDMDGLAVMEELKADPATRDIPVHLVSASDAAERGLALGAVGYLVKPATRTDLRNVVESLVPKPVDRRQILVVEDDPLVRHEVAEELTRGGFSVRGAGTGREAIEALGKGSFSCVILDLSLPDMDGLEVVGALEGLGGRRPAIVIHTARALSRAATHRLSQYAEAVVLKDGASAERIVSEVRLFARRLREEGAAGARPAVPDVSSPRLRGRKVLVTDDDMRTVYALSAALRGKGAEVLVADTGEAALQVLEEHPDVEVVLMDIMMPVMDGYEAMRRIRKVERWRDLPIIALTAKTMLGDRELCLAAGATDYLPKPMDLPRLLALLETWLGSEERAS